ncbi:MAG: phage tail assembly chaperone [Pseudomonadota bacterium]
MLPWDHMLQAALRVGVPIESFWKMSLVEWRWLAGRPTEDSLPRDAFADLMAQFPDNGEPHG